MSTWLCSYYAHMHLHTAVIRHPPSRLNKLESEVRPTLPTARSVASGQPSYYSDCGTVARSV